MTANNPPEPTFSSRGSVSLTLKINGNDPSALDLMINVQHDDPQEAASLLADARRAAIAEFLGESAAHPDADKAGNYPGKETTAPLIDIVIEPKPLEEGKPPKAKVAFFTPLRNGKRGKFAAFSDVKTTEEWVAFFAGFHFLHNGQPFVPTKKTFEGRPLQLAPAAPSTVTSRISERRKFEDDGSPGYYYEDPVSVQVA